jgi:2-polyprenyl-3-methyl-5-hydroxy-6-metoxy-1,4-benzoquinol methylase
MKNLPFTKYSLTGSPVACPICGSSKRTIISRFDRRFKILPHSKCDECALVRHEFMLSDEQLSEYYSKSYRNDYQWVNSGPTSKHIQKRFSEAKTRLNKLQPHLTKHPKVLDFGCGSGEFIELLRDSGASASGFEPGNLYASFARDQKGLDVQNCGWENFECKGKMDVVTAFHVFEHLTDPLKAFKKAISWLNVNGLIYIEVPNMANALKLKGFGSLHMAHTIGFGRYNLELLGACSGMVPLEIFDEFDISIIFKKGQPRPLTEIKRNSIDEFNNLTSKQVNKQFWLYSASKLFGKRSKVSF